MFLSRTIKNAIKNLIPDSLLMHRLPRRMRHSIVLTFDDGPDKLHTPLVLDRLIKYNVRAIFFVVGKKVQKNPELLDRIISYGHVVGNHTLSHPNRIITSTNEYQEELLQCAEILHQQTGQKPFLVRPPLGISFATLRVSKLLKAKTVLWSIEGGEAGVHKGDSAAIIGNRLNKNLQPRDIVLLHDENPKVPEILDIILPHLQNQGIDLHDGISALCPPN